MTPIEFLTGHLDGVAASVAGVLGGTVRWMTLRSDWKTGMIGLAVGGISSIYLSPLVRPMLSPLLNMVTDDYNQSVGFTGFIVGLGGITITGLVMDMISSRRKKDASDDGGKEGK